MVDKKLDEEVKESFGNNGESIQEKQKIGPEMMDNINELEDLKSFSKQRIYISMELEQDFTIKPVMNCLKSTVPKDTNKYSFTDNGIVFKTDGKTISFKLQVGKDLAEMELKDIITKRVLEIKKDLENKYGCLIVLPAIHPNEYLVNIYNGTPERIISLIRFLRQLGVKFEYKKTVFLVEDPKDEEIEERELKNSIMLNLSGPIKEVIESRSKSMGILEEEYLSLLVLEDKYAANGNINLKYIQSIFRSGMAFYISHFLLSQLADGDKISKIEDFACKLLLQVQKDQQRELGI